uniref:G_PROTEIN_RECEP_F1_2 domain-containing protein n=1 Tax=Heterorhabditis bacteriophora TaxID=37862 RepID=A0A1I7WLG5_HETBA
MMNGRVVRSVLIRNNRAENGSVEQVTQKYLLNNIFLLEYHILYFKFIFILSTTPLLISLHNWYSVVSVSRRYSLFLYFNIYSKIDLGTMVQIYSMLIIYAISLLLEIWFIGVIYNCNRYLDERSTYMKYCLAFSTPMKTLSAR